MAETLETIDGIARRLNRDVYYLALIDDDGDFRDIYTNISEVTEWLDLQQIGWSLCLGFSKESVWIEGGPGCIFLDIYPDTVAMQRIEEHFMHAEGKPLCPGYVPAVMQIDVALEFAHRDDPGFWDAF